jgi:hypothetical protein
MSRRTNPYSLVAMAMITLATGLAGTALAMAAAVTPSASTTTTTSTPATSAETAAALKQLQQQHLAAIQSRGDAEITRRLGQLKQLGSLITATTKLTASDRSTLSSEVTIEISGLTSLETQLNGETNLTAAIADAQSIFTEYRVYALVTPKVHLIKVADDQQVNEANLAALATKLQSRLTTAETKEQDVATLTTTLADMNAKVKAAQTISSSIETGVIGLQPGDYNNNNAVLSGDGAQLQTARTDNQAAYEDAQTIIKALKKL